MTKCLHLVKEPDQERAEVKDHKTGKVLFTLCANQCFEIWENDRQPNPADSQAYHVYRSIDPELPKDQWVRLTDKPTPETKFRDTTAMAGAVYYLYIVTVNALGFESDPSEVIRIGENDEAVDLE